MKTIEYLGVGVYAEFDGYGIWLKANNHENPTDKIYLEPSVLETFDLWRKALTKFRTETATDMFVNLRG